MNTKTRLTALLITLAMIVAMFPIMTLSAAATTTKVAEVNLADGTKTEYETFKDAWAVAAATTGATIKLLANCESWNSSDQNRGATYSVIGGTLTLDLNGFALKAPTTKHDADPDDNIAPESTTYGRALYVTRFATLIIKDSNPTAEHWYDKSNDLYKWAGTTKPSDADTNENKYIMIPGGVITGGNINDNTTVVGENLARGGAVFVQGGRLIVEGGNMIGNHDESSTGGGAIRAEQMNYEGVDESVAQEWKDKYGNYANISPSLVIYGGYFVGNTCVTEDNNTISSIDLNKGASGQRTLWARSIISGGVFADKLNGVKNNGIQYVATDLGYKLEQNETTGWYEAKPHKNIVFRGVQRSVNTTGSGENATYSLRLIAEVKKSVITDGQTLAAFDVMVDGVKKNLSVNKYYTKLLAQDDDGSIQAIVPRAGATAEDEYLLIAIVIDNIPADASIEMTVGAFYENDSTKTTVNAWAFIQIVNGGTPTVGRAKDNK